MFVITEYRVGEDGGYEYQQLFNAVGADNVLRINADNLFWKFSRDFPGVPVYYQGNALNNMEQLLIRPTNNARNVLGKYAALSGITGDPVDRFSASGIPKMNSELMRFFTTENLPVSYFAFNNDTLMRHQHLINYPVVYKPVRGNHGNGMRMIRNVNDLSDASRTHNYDKPIFFQQYLNIEAEYRVICFNKEILNFAKKKVNAEAHPFNGRAFIRLVGNLKNDITTYIAQHAKNGLVGIDICRCNDGRVYILEQNRAPEFEHIDRTTRRNTAQLIVEAMLRHEQ